MGSLLRPSASLLARLILAFLAVLQLNRSAYACDGTCKATVTLTFYGQVTQLENSPGSFVLSDASGTPLQTSNRVAFSYDSSDHGPDDGDNDDELVTTGKATASGIQVYDPTSPTPAEYTIDFHGDDEASGADVTVEVAQGCYEAVKTQITPTQWKIRVQPKAGKAGSGSESSAGSSSSSGSSSATIGDGPDLSFSMGDTSAGTTAGNLVVHLPNVSGVLTPQIDVSGLVSDVQQQMDGSGNLQSLSVNGQISGAIKVIVSSSPTTTIFSYYHVDGSGVVAATPFSTQTIAQSSPGVVGNVVTVTQIGVGFTNQATTYTIDSSGALIRSVSAVVGGVSLSQPYETDITTYPTVGGNPVQLVVTKRYAYAGASPEISSVATYLSTAPAPLAGLTQETISADGQRTTYAYVGGTYNPTNTTFTAGAGTYIQQEVVNTSVAAGLVSGKASRTLSIQDDQGDSLVSTFFVYNSGGWAQVNQTINTYLNSNLIRTAVDGRVTYEAIYGPDNQVATETDATGIVTTHAYNVFNLLGAESATKMGVVASGSYAAQAPIVSVQQNDANGNQLAQFKAVVYTEDDDGGQYLSYLIDAHSWSYNADGSVNTENNNGLFTGYLTQQMPDGSAITTTTHPDTGTEIRATDASGRLLSLSGTSVTSEYHTYTDNTDGTHQETVHYGTSTSANYTTTTTDASGRTIRTESPAFGGSTQVHGYYYNAKGQLTRETLTGQADRLYVYDDFGQLSLSGLDMDGNGTLDIGGTDQVQKNDTTYTFDGSNWFQVTTTSQAMVVGSATLLPSAITKTRLTLPAVMLSQSITINASGSQTTSTTTVDRAHALVTTTTTHSWLTASSISITRNGLLVSAQDPTQTQPNTYAYDDLGRPLSQKDARAGTVTTTAYDANYYYDGNLQQIQGFGVSLLYNRPTGTTVSNSLTPANTLVTTLTYVPNGQAGAGQMDTRVEVGRTTHYTYDLRGNALHVWGDTYPISYEYDGFGRLQKLHTYRTHPADPTVSTWSDGDVTTWAYDDATGLLLSKTDAASHSVLYTYWPSGALKSRTWARGVATNYGYDLAGGLNAINYSDSTPSVSITNGRVGEPLTQTDAAGTRNYNYDAYHRLSGETYASGELLGASVGRTLDGVGNEQTLTASLGSTQFLNIAFTYTPASALLDTVSAGTVKVKYAYQPQTARVYSVSYLQGTSTQLISTRGLDPLGRTGSVDSSVPGYSSAPVTHYDYQYDSHNQIQNTALSDGTQWNYGYDEKGQVQSGARQLGTGQTMGGHDFAYTYDAIGNRATTTTNSHTAVYTPNQLNQYDSVQVPPYMDISGTAASDVRVAVNDIGAVNSGSGYFASVPVTNTAAPAYPAVKVIAAQLNNSVQTVTQLNGGHYFVAQSPQSFTYDWDGNLTQDGRWNYTWDAENRLVKMETRPEVASALPALPVQRLEFAYDGQGRRIVKKVSSGSGGVWTLTSYEHFVYDGWNLLAELDATASNTPLATYTWGLDLSDSPQGAGGVGGLLWAGRTSGTYAPTYDGNGNILAWVDLVSGSTAGQAEYDPFGKPLQATGVAATLPFGFSTKYTDRESGLSCYGLRYYNPNTGRWLSRDLIEEDGGANLYAFVSNDGINAFDPYGLEDAQANYVAKSFINGIGDIGSVKGAVATRRLQLFAQLVNSRFGEFSGSKEAFNQNPTTDAKDGKYRLYTRVTIKASCCENAAPTVTIVSTDMDGGSEGPLSGTINLSKPDVTTSGSTVNVHWKGWGRPNTTVPELGMQMVKTRTSRNIWHDVTIIVSCKDGKPSFQKGAVTISKFPSFRLWKDGTQIGDIAQGALSDLWQADPRNPSFVAP